MIFYLSAQLSPHWFAYPVKSGDAAVSCPHLAILTRVQTEPQG